MKRGKSMRAVFVRPDGNTQAQDHEVAPDSRRTIHADDIPGLEASEFSNKLQSTNDVSFIAERATYWNNLGAGMQTIGGVFGVAKTKSTSVRK